MSTVVLMCNAANPRLTLCQDNAHKTDKTTSRLCRENLLKQKKERPSTPQCGRHCMQINGKRHAYGMQYISFCKAKGLFSQRKTMVFTAFLTMFHGLSAVILMHSLREYVATYYKTSRYVCTHFCGYLRPDVFYFRTTQLWSVMQKQTVSRNGIMATMCIASRFCLQLYRYL